MLLEFLYGEIKIVFKAPIITHKTVKRKWWFDKIEYYIEYEYYTLGPMKLEDAKEYLTMALRYTKYDI